MTPQTLALIEAPEAVVNEWNQEHHGLALLRAVHNLEAAISSAKAAEEGVETDYFMEFQDEAGQWFDVCWSFKGCACSHLQNEHEARAKFSENQRAPRRLMKRERTETETVIEVREKDGL